jgi:hypothetical protein
MAVVKSILKDERINAYNALVEITVGEYLKFARNVVDSNEFQRKRVIKSKIKEILREDLLRNCLIPSIVLAVSNEEIGSIKNEDDYETSSNIIANSIETNEILIIDGLQRTYVMMDLEDELEKVDNLDALNTLKAHKIRAEIYLGLNRIGLLYRMITLNTGQTTMSTRHLMEILYFDYSKVGVNGIKLIKDKDESKISETTEEYNFKIILDGFNSYLEKTEAVIDRTEILDNIKSLDVLKLEEVNRDLFKDFLLTYKYFLDTMLSKSNHWKYNDYENQEPALRLNSSPFGKTALDIFKKSQAITGFGAAISFLKDTKSIGFAEIKDMCYSIDTDNGDWNTAFLSLLKQFDMIKEKSKKIGTDQRYFFKYFFRGLFNPGSDSHLNFNKSSEYAYNELRVEKEYK